MPFFFFRLDDVLSLLRLAQVFQVRARFRCPSNGRQTSAIRYAHRAAPGGARGCTGPLVSYLSDAHMYVRLPKERGYFLSQDLISIFSHID